MTANAPKAEADRAAAPVPVRKVLVAGVGNELFGDDGFGVAVIQRLVERQRTGELGKHLDRTRVKLMNAGTRGFDLVSELVDGYAAAILVDAAPRGRAPGTLYVIEPAAGISDDTRAEQLDTWIDPHRLDPVRALLLARSLGAPLERILIVGCEPEPQIEMSMELSAPVAAAIDPAVQEVERLIGELAHPPSHTGMRAADEIGRDDTARDDPAQDDTESGHA